MPEIKHPLSDSATIGIINRGEAAVRFIRAIKEFNALHGTEMRSVAFFIDAEEDALFVQEADHALALSSLPLFAGSTGSPYLNKDLLIQALKSAGCDAVWVGWGFVSEDSAFVEMVEKAGLVFLGPSSEAMALLGDKIAAKDLADSSSVPILAWSRGPVRSLDEARVVAEKIGYPVIVKASNAGGGRGIRFVHTAADLETQFKSAREETLRITGNDIVFIEQLVVTGRHMEVQTITDRHDNVLTLGVRDCSVQRRNQKIIEETPPPGMSPEQIRTMEEAAARLIRAAGYESAGTVEFLYDVDRQEFYFMEVNTRLQVEHPITEVLYGFDLVHGQIRVARGETLSAEGLVPRGHVIEVRLNAEDPDREFTPSPGRVSVFKAPSGPGIRVDSGIQQGSSIPSDFDSMVAKIIAYGSTRNETIARMKRALNEMRIRIEGGTTNRAFVLRLLDTPEIAAGGVNTRFVEDLLQADDEVIPRDRWDIALLSCAVSRYLDTKSDELVNFKQQLNAAGHPREVPPAKGHPITLSAQGNTYNFLVKAVGTNNYHVECGEDAVSISFQRRDHESVLAYAGARYRIQIVQRGDTLQCEVGAVPYSIDIESSGFVRAPSPSIVLAVHVQPGKRVQKGDLLLSLEAMKMEMLVTATEAGTVREIIVKPGEQVAAGQPLAQIETGEEIAVETAAPTAEPVRFVRTGFDAQREQWDRLCREYHAVFLGYDHVDNPQKILDQLVSIAEGKPDYRPAMLQLLLNGVSLYSSIEALFSETPLHGEGLARAATAPELLTHFFRREVDKEKGLPEAFLERLHTALKWYPEIEEAGADAEKGVLLRLYQSHANNTRKQSLLQRSLVLLEPFEVPDDARQNLANNLDLIAFLSQMESPSLADSAIHARYVLVDRAIIENLTSEKRAKVDRVLELMIKYSDNASMLGRLRDNMLDAGHHVLPDLAAATIGADPAKAEAALDVLGRRFSRDRLHHGNTPIDTRHGALVSIASSDETGRRSTLLGICSARHPEAMLAAMTEQSTDTTELILLVVAARVDEKLWKTLEPVEVRTQSLRIGVVCPNGSRSFRTYSPKTGADGLQERTEWRGLDPLQYRELRIARYSNFDLKQLYQSESVWIMQAAAPQNARDERLFALVDVPTARFELDEHGSIRRMIALEKVFMEAVYALRAEQANRKRRLYWNRLIINVRAVFNASIDQIRDYAGKLAARASDLGIEKLVIYSRRSNAISGQPEEVELLFENISGTNFTLHGRTPSVEPLSPMDEYVDRVVRSRQRGTVYPYEIIKMITRSGYPVYETFPKGDFEEFDLDATRLQAVSVKGRPFGQNQGNIVFGVISNFLDGGKKPVRRVIILSDSTTDLGSLAEDECRRINAALDLARDRGLPVEWLPISAGARIDMDSGTENLDWTAATLRRIIEFTQAGGEINIIVAGINVGAQSYWNAEATMLMHTRGMLIMTEDASLLLTGKKALDFSGSVSAENNVGIGGFSRIMGPNGQSQLGAKSLYEAYTMLLRHYSLTYVHPGSRYPDRRPSSDPKERDVSVSPYRDTLGQGFTTIGDIFSRTFNPDRKKPFDMRQVMRAIIDHDADTVERWNSMRDAETSIVWEARLGGYAVGLIGIESRSLTRIGEVPHDGPESWTGGTLFPLSSKKTARALNAFSGRLPVVVLANLSGFDGSPESLRKLQLEYGAEIGRAVVNFKGPIVFVITARYHGGAYVVFSKTLNPSLHAVALEGSFASVIGGAPAAAVVFPGIVRKQTNADPRVVDALQRLRRPGGITQQDFDDIVKEVNAEKQAALAAEFDSIHSVERAKKVGSIDEIITVSQIRPYLVARIEGGMA